MAHLPFNVHSTTWPKHRMLKCVNLASYRYCLSTKNSTCSHGCRNGKLAIPPSLPNISPVDLTHRLESAACFVLSTIFLQMSRKQKEPTNTSTPINDCLSSVPHFFLLHFAYSHRCIQSIFTSSHRRTLPSDPNKMSVNTYFRMILSFVSRHDLTKWACVNKFWNTISTPIIWTYLDRIITYSHGL